MQKPVQLRACQGDGGLTLPLDTRLTGGSPENAIIGNSFHADLKKTYSLLSHQQLQLHNHSIRVLSLVRLHPSNTNKKQVVISGLITALCAVRRQRSAVEASEAQLRSAARAYALVNSGQARWTVRIFRWIIPPDEAEDRRNTTGISRDSNEVRREKATEGLYRYIGNGVLVLLHPLKLCCQ